MLRPRARILPIKLLKRIERLEKPAWSEGQPRRQWELVEEVKRLESEMEKLR